MRTPGCPPAATPRRGFSYVEVVVASIVFAITLTGLAATLVAQERLMRAVEQRACVLLPADRTATLTRDPAGLDADPPAPYALCERSLAEAELPATPGIREAAYGTLREIDGPIPSLLVPLDGRRGHVPADGWRVEPPGFAASMGTPGAYVPTGITEIVTPSGDDSSITIDVLPLEPTGS